jgi:hypothetical protein
MGATALHLDLFEQPGYEKVFWHRTTVPCSHLPFAATPGASIFNYHDTTGNRDLRTLYIISSANAKYICKSP